jgi:hypothetical protein
MDAETGHGSANGVGWPGASPESIDRHPSRKMSAVLWKILLPFRLAKAKIRP